MPNKLTITRPLQKLARRRLARAMVEALDRRTMLAGGPEAILVINGTAGNDTMRLSFDFVNNEFVSKVNSGAHTHWPAAGITAVNFAGLGGSDEISLVMSNGVPIVVNGGDGNDSIIVGAELYDLSKLPGSDATLNGGAGQDAIVVRDHAYQSSATFSINDTRFDRSVWSGFTYGADVEAMHLYTGNASNTLNIGTTRANVGYLFSSATDGDTLNFGNAITGMQSIRGSIAITSLGINNVINLDNGADTADRTWEITANATLEILNDFAPAQIYWNIGKPAVINMMCTGGQDNGTIGSMHSDFTIDTSAELNGRDRLHLGNATWGMQHLVQRADGDGFFMNNGPGRTIMYFDNGTDTVARTGLLDLVSGYNQLTGICPMTIWYDDNDASGSTLTNGTGADRLGINRLGGVSGLTVDNAGGADRVILGEYSHTLQEIAIGIEVISSGATGTNSIWLDNGGDAVPRSVTVDYDSTLGRQTVVGLSPGIIYYDPTKVSTDLGVTIIDGLASSDYHITANRALLTLHNWLDHIIEFDGVQGVGDDVVTVGGSGGLDLVTATVRVRNLYSHTALTMSDIATSTPEDVRFALNPQPGFNYQGAYLTNPARSVSWATNEVVSPVTYLGGGGDDHFLFRNTMGAGIKVVGGDGNDAIVLGDLGNGFFNADLMEAPMTLMGNAGEDTLTINNTNGNDGTWGILPSTIERDAAVFLTHSLFEQINLHTSNQGEQATITGNFNIPNADIAIHSGTGDDDFLIEAGRPDMTIELFASSTGSTGNDDLEASRATTSALSPIVTIPQGYRGYLDVDEGARVNITGSIPAYFTTEFFIGDGVLDVGAAGAVAEYGQQGPSRIDDVQAFVTTGYNGGNWLGDGITSSLAIADPNNNAVGYAESNERFDAFPATFNGLSGIDDTAVLIYSTLPGDVNIDETVNFNDLLTVAQNYGTATGASYNEGDLTYDGAVNFLDLLLIAQNYGESALTQFSNTFIPSRTQTLSSIADDIVRKD